MEIKGMVHCFFEQSGTFKNEFIKLSIPAEDYDIQNEFGETDHIIDLFNEIENGYDGKPSIFDKITKDDLIIAFFPCIYFCANNAMFFMQGTKNLRYMDKREISDMVLNRNQERTKFYTALIKMLACCSKDVNKRENIRLILENPYTKPNFLEHNLFIPTMIDKNRRMRGDYFIKPTAYWFINCEPTNGKSFQINTNIKSVSNCKSAKHAGLCSTERSMISPDYARNFICDFILGKEQKNTIPQLKFDE